MQDGPNVSIVTPALNAARFIEETIQSVLAQDYPSLEYIIMDGGSTDGTAEIVRRYAGRLRYVSAPDQGAADAVNRGFRLSRGSILAWINADDVYLPGAVRRAVNCLNEHPEAAAVYGDARWVDASGQPLGSYPTFDFDSELLSQECFICQPACFFRRPALDAAGALDTRLQFAFDYDLWIRMAREHRLLHLPAELAVSRMYPHNKTLGQRSRSLRESMAVLQRHYSFVPFGWVYSYCYHLWSGRDLFFEPLQPSIAAYAMSLPVGLYFNRSRAIRRYLGEWTGALREGLKRRLRRLAPRR